MEDKLKIYEYYFSIIDLMLNDMDNITPRDIADVVDELHQELDKLGAEKIEHEM